jgi:hypothetical protein
MAIGSQAGKAATMSGLTGLTHDVFVGSVVDNVRRESACAMAFQDAQPGTDYTLVGQNTVFAADLNFVNGAMASPNGKLPDHVDMDAVQGKVTATRRYRRIAKDNFVEKRASGAGSYEEYADRLFKLLWSSWGSMEIRHAVGGSTGYACLCSSRTSSTVFVAKDGYGHTGTNPISNLSKGTVIAWYDVSAVGIGGAAKISSINESTNAITVDSATTWEPSAQLAAGDYILFATTTDSTSTYFDTEKDGAPNGVGTILDPDAGSTTVFNISQTTYPRWKPYRQASSTFDHLEVQDHWNALAVKRGIPVNRNDDVVLAHPGPVAQLARSLMGFQQQAYTGGDLNGGWTGVTIGNMQITQDPFFYHDVLATLHKPALYRVNLGGDADFWQEDGSQWARIADFDGAEAQVGDYMNYFSTHRGAHGAITSIVTSDITDTQFDPVANF